MTPQRYLLSFKTARKLEKKCIKKIRNNYNRYKLSSINVKIDVWIHNWKSSAPSGSSSICKKEWERD